MPALTRRSCRVRLTFALAASTCAFVTSAWRCSTCCWNGVGSSSARSCPFFTRLLKSVERGGGAPETGLPTWTVVTAERVPVAVTVWVMSPRSAFSVLYCSSFFPRPRQEPARTARLRSTAIRLTLVLPPRQGLRQAPVIAERAGGVY